MRRFIRFIVRWIKGLLALLLMIAVLFSLTPVTLSIPEQSQYPSLPNGCESVSAAACLNYLGEYTAAETFASEFLPKGPIGTVHPKKAYVGEPSAEGYYCFQKPLVQGINSFLSTRDTTVRAKSHPFVPFLEVALRVHFKKPVIVWTTVDGKLPSKNSGVVWNINGRNYDPYDNLHVVVVDGIKGLQVHMVDSVNGAHWTSLIEFLPRYYAMGMRAVYFTD